MRAIIQKYQFISNKIIILLNYTSACSEVLILEAEIISRCSALRVSFLRPSLFGLVFNRSTLRPRCDVWLSISTLSLTRFSTSFALPSLPSMSPPLSCFSVHLTRSTTFYLLLPSLLLAIHFLRRSRPVRSTPETFTVATTLGTFARPWSRGWQGWSTEREGWERERERRGTTFPHRVSARA